MSKGGDGAEGGLLSTEQEIRLLVETIPTPVWRAAPDGNVEYVNKRALEYFSSPADEILGWGWMRQTFTPTTSRSRSRPGSKIFNPGFTTHSADFAERTVAIDGSMCAANRSEPAMAGCFVGMAF